MRNVYTPSNLFFDDMLLFLMALSSLSLGIQVQRKLGGTPFGPTDNIVLHGKPSVTAIEYRFFPYESFVTWYGGGWPSSFELEESDSYTTPNVFSSPVKLTSPGKKHKELWARLLQVTFVQFYESIKDRIKRKYTRDHRKWPMVLNFSRVLRNAFAHSGKITFLSRNPLPVDWKSLHYNLVDNGKRILFREMAIADIIKLIVETDSVL